MEIVTGNGHSRKELPLVSHVFGPREGRFSDRYRTGVRGSAVVCQPGLDAGRAHGVPAVCRALRSACRSTICVPVRCWSRLREQPADRSLFQRSAQCTIRHLRVPARQFPEPGARRQSMPDHCRPWIRRQALLSRSSTHLSCRQHALPTLSAAVRVDATQGSPFPVPNLTKQARSVLCRGAMTLSLATVAVLAISAPATALAEAGVSATGHDGLAHVSQLIDKAAPEEASAVMIGVVSMVHLVQVASWPLLDVSAAGPQPNALAPLAGVRTEVVAQRRSSGASRQRTASSDTASAPWYVTAVISILCTIAAAAVSLRVAARTRRYQVRDLADQRVRETERERLEEQRQVQARTEEQRRNERQDRDAEYQDINAVLREVNTLVAAAERRQVLFTGDYDFDGLQHHIDRIVGNSTPPDLKPPLDKLAVCIREVQQHVLPTQDDFDAGHPNLNGSDYTSICYRAAQQRTAVEELSIAHREAYEALRAWARVDV